MKKNFVLAFVVALHFSPNEDCSRASRLKLFAEIENVFDM
jgi:hypothetical protein